MARVKYEQEQLLRRGLLLDVGLQLRRGLIIVESAPRLEREVSGTTVEGYRT